MATIKELEFVNDDYKSKVEGKELGSTDFLGKENEGHVLTADTLQTESSRKDAKINEVIKEVNIQHESGAYKKIIAGDGVVLHGDTDESTTLEISIDRTDIDFLGYSSQEEIGEVGGSDFGGTMWTGKLTTDMYTDLDFDSIKVGQHFELKSSVFPQGASFTKRSDGKTPGLDAWYINGFVKSSTVDSTVYKTDQSKNKVERDANKAASLKNSQDIATGKVGWDATTARSTADHVTIGQQGSEIALLKIFETETSSKDVIQTGKIASLETISAVHSTGIKENKDKIGTLESDVSGLQGSKQGAGLSYKSGTTVEEQIEANEKENIASKNREANFVNKSDGLMSTGYSSSDALAVVTNATLTTEFGKTDAVIADLRTQLANKATVEDITAQKIIYTFPTPIVTSEHASKLTFTFDSAFATWLSEQKDTSGNPIIIKGVKAQPLIGDSSDANFESSAIDEWNDSVETDAPFGTDASAKWSTTESALTITTTAGTGTMILKSIAFLIGQTAVSNVDQVARDSVAALEAKVQPRSITAISNLKATTVENALAELQANDDALKEKTINQSSTADVTTFSKKVSVTDIFDAKAITQDGHAVALKSEVLEYVHVDDSDTVSKAIDQIKTMLNDKEGSKAVLFSHSASAQTEETYEGTIRIIESDPIEKGKAYFGQSNINHWTNNTTVEKYMFKLELMIENFKIWQRTLDVADRINNMPDATLDSFTQSELNLLTIGQVRRQIPVKTLSHNVIVNAHDFIDMFNNATTDKELLEVLKVFATAIKGNTTGITAIPKAAFKDGSLTSLQTGVGYSKSEADDKVTELETKITTTISTLSSKKDLTDLDTKLQKEITDHVQDLSAYYTSVQVDTHIASAKDEATKTAHAAAVTLANAAEASAKAYTDSHTPTLPVSMTLHFDDGTTQVVKVGQ